MDRPEAHKGKKHFILILDDNPVFLQAVIRLLISITHIEVIGTASKSAALDVAENLHPEVIFVDMDMPYCSGINSISQLRKILPQSKIIAMSMLNDRGFRKLALSVGADDLIYKPEIEDRLSTIPLPRITC